MTLDLTDLKKRFQPQSALALTVEPAQIVVGVARLGNEQVPASLAIPIGADDLVKSPERAGKELAAALHAAGIRERRAVVCIPSAWALTASADLPDVGKEDLRGYLELRAEGEFSIAVADLRLAHSPYSLADGQKRATLAAVSAKRLAAVEKTLATAGCRPVSISLALEGCLAQGRPLLHFLVSEDHTDLVISTADGIAAMRTLSNPFDSEETGGSEPSDRSAAPAGPARLGPFVREIRITLGRLPESLRQSAKQARFCGPASATQALRGGLQEELQRMGIQCLPDEPSSNPAIECAKRCLRNEAVTFEFVAAEINRWSAKFERFNTRRGRQIAAASAALVFVPMLCFMAQAHRASSLEAEWDGMKNTVASINAQQQKIRQFRPWFEPTPHTLQIFESLIAAFPENGDVWSKSVQVEGGSKVTCTGFARSEPARMGLLDRLRKKPGVTELKTLQVRGENPIQFAITFTWESRDE